MFKVAVLEVGLTELRVRRHQDKQVFLVDIDKELAEGQLLNTYLDSPIGVLAQSKLIQGLVTLEQLATDAVVHLGVLLLRIERHWLLLLIVGPFRRVTLGLGEGVTGIISHILLHHLLVLTAHDDIVSGSHGLILVLIVHLLLHLLLIDLAILQLHLLLVHFLLVLLIQNLNIFVP